jgi:hypothetical protein
MPEIREFLWLHHQSQRRGLVTVDTTTVHGSQVQLRLLVEPDARGRWVVCLERFETGRANDEKSGAPSLTESHSYAIVERVRGTMRSVSQERLADDTIASGSEYRLRLWKPRSEEAHVW